MKHVNYRWLLGIAFGLILASATAQEQTELYIPIGKSPGLSGTETDIGQITAVDAGSSTISVDTERGPATVTIDDETRIWLDHSLQMEPNEVGNFADLGSGRTVEIRYRDSATRSKASWVKVRTVQ